MNAVERRLRADVAIDLDALEKELERKPLDEIAMLVRALTYEQMLTLAAAVWNMRPTEGDLAEGDIAGTLHRWSMGLERKSPHCEAAAS